MHVLIFKHNGAATPPANRKKGKSWGEIFLMWYQTATFCHALKVLPLTSRCRSSPRNVSASGSE